MLRGICRRGLARPRKFFKDYEDTALLELHVNRFALTSSCPEVFCKKGVFKKFHKIQRKTPVSESLP